MDTELVLIPCSQISHGNPWWDGAISVICTSEKDGKVVQLAKILISVSTQSLSANVC